MKTKTYEIILDPGHAWLKVSRNELKRLNLENAISSCSYQLGNSVYLEEDCDALKFLATKQAKHEPYRFTEISYDDHCFVRRYAPYQPEAVVLPTDFAAAGWNGFIVPFMEIAEIAMW